MSSLQTNALSDLQLDPSISRRLSEFARRRVQLLTLRSVSAGAISLITTMSLVALSDYFWILDDTVRRLLSMIAYGVSLGLMFRYRWHRADRSDLLRIAKQFESADPRLREDVLSAVELADPQSANGSPSFRQGLQQRTGHRLVRVDVRQLLPLGLIRPWLTTAVVLLLATCIMTAIPRIQFGRRIARAMLPTMAIERASLTRIKITAPSPPSGPVAAGDAIGVVADIFDAESSGARLQWRISQGTTEEVPMMRRSDTRSHSAILTVAQEPIDYRILAGDAVTLWYRLSPVPRPQVESFSKRYVFPDYAMLDDQSISEDDDGELKAVRGTIAHVTTRLNEPCSEVAIRFVGSVRKMHMQPADASNTVFSIAIPLTEPARYQVIAIGQQSGLESGQIEPFDIISIPDAPPVVAWTGRTEPQQIVSVMDVVSLQVQVTDEFPVDQVIQEYQINDGPTFQRPLVVSHPSDRLNVDWQWDLLDPQVDDSERPKISSGDIVQTQVFSLDRKGQRGESTKRIFMVANQGFAPDRHAQIERLNQAIQAVIAWTQSVSEAMSQASPDVKPGDPLEPTDQILFLLSQLLESAPAPAEAGRLELLADSVADLQRKITVWFAEHHSVMTEDDPQRKSQQEELVHELDEIAAQLSREGQQIENYGRDLLSHQLSLGLIDDAWALTTSIQEVLATDVTEARNARQLRIVDGWLTEIDTVFSKYRASLSETSQRLSDSWSEWRQQQSERILQALSNDQRTNDQRINDQRQIFQQLEHELRTQQSDHAIYSRQASMELVNGVTELAQQTGFVDRSVRDLITSGTKLDKAEFFADRFRNQRERSLKQLEQKRERHTHHPFADLAFIADLGLMRRAMDQVTKDGIVVVADQPADVVLKGLADAFEVLQSGHVLTQWQGELRSLIDTEMDPPTHAGFRFENPQRFERYLAGIRWLNDRLNALAIDHETFPPDVHASSQPQIQRARELLSSRRFDREQVAPAQIQLRKLDMDVTAYLNLMEPFMQSARATLRRYAIPLHQQAREASEQVQRTIESLQSDDRSQLNRQRKFAEADAATKETMESLADLASTLATADQQSRELARDADSALTQISNQRDRVGDAMRNDAFPDEMAAELDQLRQRLDQTAEHFQRANSGQDLTESRQQMRRGEDDQQTSEKLDQRSERAEALSKAAGRDAEELREQLEKEAQQNETMRDAMSEIARQTARSALLSLQQAAKDERSLNRTLERADPNLAERKQRLTDELAATASELASLQNDVGTQAMRAAKNHLDSSVSDEFQKTFASIARATELAAEMRTSDNLQSSIIKIASDMASAVQDASDSIDQLLQTLQEPQHPELDEQPRTAAARDAERILRDVRDQQIRAANQQKRDWTQAKQNAERRAELADQQAQEFKKQLQAELEVPDQPNVMVQEKILEMEQQVAAATKAKEAAEQSVGQARERMNRITARADALRNQGIELGEEQNPNIELTIRLSSSLQQELDRALMELRQIVQEMESSPPLESPPFAVAPLKVEQQRIRDDLDHTGNELRRAALNEQRLGRDAAAEQLAQSATRVKQVAMSAASNAISEMERVSVEPTAATGAQRQVTQAVQQIEREANQLAKLLGELSPDTDDRNSQQSDPEAQRGKQLAKTLDELDQARAEQADRQSESGQTAGEASPTLQQAMDQAARQAAQERRQQIDQNPSEGQNTDGPPSDSSAQNPTSGSGQGAAMDDQRIRIDEIDRDGTDWGQLQSRRPEIPLDRQRTRIPPKYRQQIDAYFRAIAERSAGVDP